MTRKKKISLKDIAAASGVSTAAVSYALSGKGRLSKETREAVLKAVDELGFIPDSTAKRLRTGQSNLLGAIVNDVSNPFFAEMLSEFEALAYDNGYLTIVANAKDDLDRQKALVSALLSQGVAGLLISPVKGTSRDALKALTERELPFVVCVRDVGEAASDFIGFDDRAAGYIAASRMLERGIGRFALVGGFRRTKTWADRILGIEEAVREHRREVDGPILLPGPPTREFGAVATARLVADHPDCDAAICFNDYVAFGAYASLSEAGRTIGEDYSVIGFDNVPQSASMQPPLTTIEMFPRQIGRQCAELMVDRVRGAGQVVRKRILVKPEIVPRASVIGEN